MTYQRRVGTNTDPDFFEFAISSKRFSPNGSNRGDYRYPRIDALTDQIRVEMDREKREALSSEVQKSLPKISPTCRYGSTTLSPSTDVLSALRSYLPRRLFLPYGLHPNLADFHRATR